MDYAGGPDDNTSVVKMVKSLYTFLDKPQPRFQEKYDFSFDKNSTRASEASSSYSDTLNKSRKRSFNADYSTLSRDEKAEILYAKTKVSKLEEQMKTLETEKKVVQIEQDKRRRSETLKNLKNQEECESLRKTMTQLFAQKEEIEDEMKVLKKKHSELKQQYNADKSSWSSEKSQLTSQLYETEGNKSKQQQDLREKCIRLERDSMESKSQYREAEALLKTFKDRQKENGNIMTDYNELKYRCRDAEHKVKVLEEKLSKVDESALLMQRNQSELSKFRQIERENSKLKEDNKLYRASADNALTLQEIIDTTTRKLENSEKKLAILQNLEYENQRLKSKLEKWESEELYGGMKVPNSPIELTRMIAELQKTQLNMAEKQGELEASIYSQDSLLTSKTEECSHLNESTLILKSKHDILEDQCQKLQRRLTLVSTERDGLRRVLSSYEKEEGSNYEKEEGSKLIKRVQEADDALEQCSNHVAQLENDLMTSQQEISTKITEYLQLQLDYEKLKSASLFTGISKTNDASIHLEEIETLKKQIFDLQTKYEEVLKEKNDLEMFHTRRRIKGEYDPRKTRVLQLSFNPLAIAHKKEQEKSEAIKKENGRLREKIMKLQQARQAEEDESMNVSRLIKSSKPMEDALKQIDSERLKAKRLEEQFKKKAKDFRMALLEILGFDFKQVQSELYQIKSGLAESRDDLFLFKYAVDQDGTANSSVVQNEYTRQWMHLIDEYLTNGNSIPAFLAAVQLDLHSRSTHIRQNRTLPK